MKTFSATIIILVIFSTSVYPQDSLNISFLSRMYNFWDYPDEIMIADDYAYVATGYSGLQIFDLIRPDNPVNISLIDQFPGGLSDFDIEGGWLFGAIFDIGMVVIDITDPYLPELTTFYDELASPRGICVTNDIAYIVCSQNPSLFCLDVSNPHEPVIVGTYNSDTRFISIEVVDDLAYILDTRNGLRILDVSNVNNIYEISYVPIGYYYEDLYYHDNYVYITSNYGLHVVDVSDVENPELTFQRHYESSCYHIDIIDNILYVVNQGIRIFNLENPGQPEETAYLNDGRYYKGIGVIDNRAYLTCTGPNAFSAISLDNQDELETISFDDRHYRVYNLQELNDYLYVSLFDGTMRTVNISDPGNPFEVFQSDEEIRSAHSVIYSEYLYTYDRDFGLMIYDLSNPENPEMVYNIRINDLCQEIVESNGRLYLNQVNPTFAF